MHSTGHFIEDKRAFSAVGCGHRTAVYLKLANELTISQWNSFYTSLRLAGDFQEKLKEFSRPVENWTDDPNAYFIMGSDPAEEEVEAE